MQASRPAGEDRLPWLEPYREEVRPARRGAARPRRSLVLSGAALALAVGAAAGGYWLGQREAPPQPRTSAIVPLPPAVERPAPVEQAPRVEPAAPLPTEKIEPAPPPKADKAPDKPAAAAPAKIATAKRNARRTIRSPGVEDSRLSAVRKAQEPVPAPARRAWPKMPSPGPAGQVIQLGAFSTPARAYAAYGSRVARYPVLQTMPRVVVPIVTGRRQKLLYVLRLGTASRQQSQVVCRNLRASGDHCIVIG